MLTLSDTENNLHFILILQGLIKHKEKGERGRQKGEGVWRSRTEERRRNVFWDDKNINESFLEK